MIQVIEKELTHYRVPVFSRLQEALDEDVVVYHGAPAPGSALNTVDRGESLSFRHRRMATRWLLDSRAYVQNLTVPAVEVGDARAVILRHSLRNLAFFPFLWWCRLRACPAIGWGQAYSRHRPFDPEGDLRDRMHLAVVQACDAYVCYSESIRERLSSFVPREKLFVARNTLDVEKLAGWRRDLEREGVEAVRRSLGLDRSCYLSFVGRLMARKKLDVLIDLYEQLRREHGLELGLLILGDGPMRPQIEQSASERGLDGIRFLGEKYEREAARYLFASDVMVMPGWLGLSVVHAMALGVPVVSQRAGPGLVGHPPEAGYLESGTTGFMTPPDNLSKMTDAVLEILENRDDFSRAASAHAERELGQERMVRGFVDAISYAAG